MTIHEIPADAAASIETVQQPDYGDPTDWDEWPDGFGSIIATELEDRGWHIDGYDDTVVNVTAADGTETGVWFARGKCWTGRSVDGECKNPIDILAVLADPEEIAGRADAVMREIGLKPGKPAPVAEDDDSLPHDDYMGLVAAALEAAGIKPETWWTETADGEILDGVFKFDDPRITQEWPDGIYLAWGQNRGWALITEGQNRWVMDLPIGAYAHPDAVAFATLRRALNLELAEINDDWDDAAATLAKVEAWEAEGR